MVFVLKTSKSTKKNIFPKTRYRTFGVNQCVRLQIVRYIIILLSCRDNDTLLMFIYTENCSLVLYTLHIYRYNTHTRARVIRNRCKIPLFGDSHTHAIQLNGAEYTRVYCNVTLRYVILFFFFRNKNVYVYIIHGYNNNI